MGLDFVLSIYEYPGEGDEWWGVFLFGGRREWWSRGCLPAALPPDMSTGCCCSPQAHTKQSLKLDFALFLVRL